MPTAADLVVWALGLALSGCGARDRLPTSTADLTIATYNVNFGLAGDDEAVRAVEATHADVVLLQETNASWERLFRDRLAGTYPHMAFGHSTTWPAGGLGVLSRWPVEVRDVSPSPSGYFFAWRVVVHAPAGDVQMLNVHLVPPTAGESNAVSAYLASRDLRRREMERHVALLERDLPTFVAGDFNEDEDGRAVGVLRARGMTSALPEFEPRARTWRWPVGPFTLRLRLDHVLYDPRAWTCLDARVLDAGRSDHLPVVARFARRGRGATGARARW